MMRTRLFALLVWAVVLPALAGAVIMTLWNFVCPPTFGWAALSYAQAVSLFLLCQLLFGGIVLGLVLLAGVIHTIGFHGNRMAHSHRAQAMRERWANMSDDERRRWFEGIHGQAGNAMRSRCRNCPGTGEIVKPSCHDCPHRTNPQENGEQ